MESKLLFLIGLLSVVFHMLKLVQGQPAASNNFNYDEKYENFKNSDWYKKYGPGQNNYYVPQQVDNSPLPSPPKYIDYQGQLDELRRKAKEDALKEAAAGQGEVYICDGCKSGKPRAIAVGDKVELIPKPAETPKKLYSKDQIAEMMGCPKDGACTLEAYIDHQKTKISDLEHGRLYNLTGPKPT